MDFTNVRSSVTINPKHYGPSGEPQMVMGDMLIGLVMGLLIGYLWATGPR